MSYHNKPSKVESFINAVFSWTIPVMIVALVIGTAIKLI